MSTTMNTFKQEPSDQLQFLFDNSTPEFSDDFHLIKSIVTELKLNGLFDQLRKVCLANMEAKSTYANFRQRVETTVAQRLGILKWTSDMDTNVLRQQLKKHLTLDLQLVDEEFDALVDEVFTADLINQTREAVLTKLKTMYKDDEMQESGAESATVSTVPSASCESQPESKSILSRDNSLPMDLDGIPLPPPPEQRSSHSGLETVIKSEHLEEKVGYSKKDEMESTDTHSKDKKHRSSGRRHEHHSDRHSSNKSQDRILTVEQECKNVLTGECSVQKSPSNSSIHLTVVDSKEKDGKESVKSLLSDGANKDQACELNSHIEFNQESEFSQSSSGSSSNKSKQSKHTSKSEKHSSKDKSKSHSSKSSHHSKSHHSHKCESKTSSKDNYRKVTKGDNKIPKKPSSHEIKDEKMKNTETSDEVSDKSEDELLYFEETEADVNLEFANTLVRRLEEDDTWSQISSVSVDSADLSDLDYNEITVNVDESDWSKINSMLGDGVD